MKDKENKQCNVAQKNVRDACDNLNWNVMMDHLKFIELGIRNLYDPVEADGYKKALRLRSKKNPSGEFMHLTSRIEKAIETAAEVHQDQFRQLRVRSAFVCHPLCVAEIIARFTKNEDVIIAGLLHETIDNGGGKYSIKNLHEDFGNSVAKIVPEITENIVLRNHPYTTTTWKERKRIYLLHLEDHATQEGLMVSCADIYHDLQRIYSDYKEWGMGEKLWQLFANSKEDIFWYNHTALKLFSNKLKCTAMIDEFEEKFNLLLESHKEKTNDKDS